MLFAIGLAMGGMYSWGAWIYSYNREAWMNDIQVRQNHDFQRDNMQISAHDMSRGEVRDRTQAAITKLSNYILVTTLILSLGAEMLVEGQVPDDCPDFVLNVYMLCLGSSMFYLIMSILFGVAASQEIYESYVELLTDKVPPPWEPIDGEMLERQRLEHTRAFEDRPWREIFMPPLLQSTTLRDQVKLVRNRVAASLFRCWRPRHSHNEKTTRLGSATYVSASTGVLSTVDGASSLPKPRRSLPGHSASASAPASASASASALLQLPGPAVASQQQPQATRSSFSLSQWLDPNFAPSSTEGGGAAGAACSSSGARGAKARGEAGRGGGEGDADMEFAGEEAPPEEAAETGGESRVFGFFKKRQPGHDRKVAHGIPAIFPDLTPATTARPDSPTRRRSSSMLDQGPPAPGTLRWIEHSYDTHWEQHETAWLPLQTHSGVCAALGLRNLLQAYGYLCMANLYGNNGSAWTFWAIQFIFVSLNVLTTQFLCQRVPRERLFMMAAGPISCALAATTPWLLWDRILVPVCYFCHLLLALREGCEAEMDLNTSLQDQGTARALDQDQEGRGLGGSPSKREENYHGASPATDLSTAPLGLLRAISSSNAMFKNIPILLSESPTASKKRAEQKRIFVHRLMHGGAAIVQFLWFSSAIWSLYVSALHPSNFKNSKAVLSFASRPPVADLTTLKTSWSIYFRPHAMVCPESQIFLADSFRVYELLPSTQMVQPYPCSVNNTIADVTAVCEHGHCWPVVLLDSDPPMVLDCYSGWTKPLQQTQGRAFRMAAQGGRDMFVQSAHHVVRYEWSELKQSWSPVWEVAKLVENPKMQHLTALDVVDDRLLMFGRGAVEVQDLDSGDSCGVWQLPPEVRGAGCAIEGGNAVLLLGQKERVVSEGTVGGIGPKMELLCADLPTPRGTPCGDDMVHSSKRGVQAVYTCKELLERHLWKKA